MNAIAFSYVGCVSGSVTHRKLAYSECDRVTHRKLAYSECDRVTHRKLAYSECDRVTHRKLDVAVRYISLTHPTRAAKIPTCVPLPTPELLNL
ncbi:MAG: hypothetical protein F6K56_02935 [Moorea sp. SIO3G5]|nr:hypothetical protein [Moorena sp. SIO3G5]